MATVRKILGQLNPSAATVETVYTVPAATECVISSIVVCNTSDTGAADSFSIAVIPSGDTLATKNLVYVLIPINGNNTFVATVGITLGAGDYVQVFSTSGESSFSLFGMEIT
jgi:hypothetical protein